MSKNPLFQVGLIGGAIAHSVSPAMHNAAFQVLGLPWQYSLLPTPPDQVGARLQELVEGGYRGANVTVPHKQAVLPYLDGLSETARAMGAVNTLLFAEGRIWGDNTDAEGLMRALGEARFDPAGAHALILGAGGAARAAAFALGSAGCPVTIHNRTPERAQALALDMTRQGFSIRVAPELETLDLAALDLLVNTTSVGMWPHVDASPWPESLPLPSHWTVMDLVYNPAETRLLARARAAGAICVGGLGMLVHQGALAFELWTGHKAPIDVMRAAAEAALRG